VFTVEEIELVEEAFLIKHVTEWEMLIQNILTYCIAIDTSALSQHLDLRLPKKMGFDNAHAILNGLNFISITNTGDLKGLAKKIIVEKNNPFKNLENNILRNIDEAYVIRNYIAHKSKKSKQRLMKLYKERYQITNFLEPGKFLRQKIEQEEGSVLRSDTYYGAFMGISTFIWQHLDPNSYNFIFEDNTSLEGVLKGIMKMNIIFNRLTKENNI
jgi:hypothetical protein